jgi:hypothetical protein
MEDLLAERIAGATPETLRFIHLNKTAAMIEASLAMGGRAAAPRRLGRGPARGGRELGLAFQIVDDILDATSDTATLGKTAGKDAKAGKATYVSVHGSRPRAGSPASSSDAAIAALRACPATPVPRGPRRKPGPAHALNVALQSWAFLRLLSGAPPHAPTFSARRRGWRWLLATPAFASETVTKAQVLDAIRTFDANASGNLAAPEAGAPRRRRRWRGPRTRSSKYALESDDVVVDLGPDSVPWCDVKKGLRPLTPASAGSSSRPTSPAASRRSSSRESRTRTPTRAGSRCSGSTARQDARGGRDPRGRGLLARQMDGTLEAYAVAARSARATASAGPTARPRAPPRQDQPALAAQP